MMDRPGGSFHTSAYSQLSQSVEKGRDARGRGLGSERGVEDDHVFRGTVRDEAMDQSMFGLLRIHAYLQMFKCAV